MAQPTIMSNLSYELSELMDDKLKAQIKNWMEWDQNSTTRDEIMNAIKEKNWDTLRARLCCRITFGTAGLRARMQAGFDSMNDLVVVQTAQGLCAYIKQQYTDETAWAERGIVLGYDSRYNSKRFAELTAIVFLQNKFRVYLFKQFVATPMVPFTILRLKCLGGVMVTASHNPKEDNGYKVYWTNGAQIISPHDSGIHESILKNLEPKKEYWDETVLLHNSGLIDPYKSVVKAYYEVLKNIIAPPFLERNRECNDAMFTYTAMHGVGFEYVKLAFETINMIEFKCVLEQIKPDPEFPTVKFPNPEEGKSSLELAIKTANECGTPIILANDPDADRLAVAEKNSEHKWKIFNGNELGALLGWWSIFNHTSLTKEENLSNCVMIASTVSSKILRSMAKKHGFTFYETLTGFKWMGNKAIEVQEEGKTVLFAFEEAIGFMISSNVFDKDGVSAAAHVATMAYYLRTEKGMTLQEKLNDIYKTYGFHTSVCSYVICRNQQLIQQIFNRLRTFNAGKKNTYPTSILNGEFEIEHVRDLTTGYDSSVPDQKALLPISSSTQMITFTFTNGLVITLRTSGTEPKMKYYAEICGKPGEEDWNSLTCTLNRMVEAIVDEFYEPNRHGLERKAD